MSPRKKRVDTNQRKYTMTRITGTTATDMTRIASSIVESLQTFAAAVEIVEAHGITDAMQNSTNSARSVATR